MGEPLRLQLAESQLELGGGNVAVAMVAISVTKLRPFLGDGFAEAQQNVLTRLYTPRLRGGDDKELPVGKLLGDVQIHPLVGHWGWQQGSA